MFFWVYISTSDFQLTVEQDIQDLLGEEDKVMTSPTELSAAASAPPLTYTPYPNVLNPIDEPPSGKKRSSESFQAPPTMQQRSYAYEASPPSQYLPASPQLQPLTPTFPTSRSIFRPSRQLMSQA